MATIDVTQDRVRIHLSALEQAGAMHGDLSVPIDNIAAVTAHTDLWENLRGMRAPGTGIPGVIMLGTTRSKGAKDFCAVYGHKPGLLLETRDFEFARVLVSCPVEESEQTAAKINAMVMGEPKV